jgi:hypothetical protein
VGGLQSESGSHICLTWMMPHVEQIDVAIGLPEYTSSICLLLPLFHNNTLEFMVPFMARCTRYNIM